MRNLKFFIIFAIAIYFSACNNSNIEMGKQSVKVNASECKQFSRTVSADSTGPETDCIIYEYNGETKILSVKHINAAFNCCPDKISADVLTDSMLIKIEEKEKLLSPCKCNCLYDLEYEIKNVANKSYILEIVEPYLDCPDEMLRFDLDFSKQPTGKLCKKRTIYPWVF